MILDCFLYCDGESLLSKKKQIYTEEEADKLTELLADAPMKYAVFISISLSIGSRRSETIGLKWDKVHFDKDLISIEATTNYTPADGIFDDTTKNETSIRTVKVELGLCELMRLYKRTQEDQKAKLGTKWEEGGYLFTQWDGKPMHPKTPYIWLKKLCDKNGLPFYGIHALRHYNISYRLKCKEDIASVSAAAGHSSPRTTLQIYSHMIAESQAENSIPLAEPIDCTKLLAKKTKTIDQAPQQEMLKSARTVVITRSKPQTRNNPTFGVKRKTRKPRK